MTPIDSFPEKVGQLLDAFDRVKNLVFLKKINYINLCLGL
jgi:hypothetical protein